MRDELREAFPHAALHPMDCDCGHCRPRRPVGQGGGGTRIGDPIAARRERMIRIQAGFLGAAIVLLYGLALFLAPQIAASLRHTPDHIEIAGGVSPNSLPGAGVERSAR